MSSHFRVYSLDVGQGMSTLFVVYDADGGVTALALFDLGSLGKKSIAGPATIEFLKNMALQRESPNGRIDAVFISHKDGDHINLLFGSEGGSDPVAGLLRVLPDMAVGLVRYGGRYSWYDKTVTLDGISQNLLTLLKARTEVPALDVRGFPVGATGYPGAGTQRPLWSGPDYDVLLLAANTPYNDEPVGTAENDISKEPDGDQANSKSLVLLLMVNAGVRNYAAVIGGDATFPTFQYINGFVDRALAYSVFMALLPHHGSRKTTFGLGAKSKPISDEARDVVDTYADNINADTLIASADTNARYGHPSLETSQLFLKYADPDVWWTDPLVGNGRHFTTAFVDYALDPATYNQQGMRTFLTTQNLYSTRYYDSAVVSVPMVAYAPFASFTQEPYNTQFSHPPGMNWIYTLLPQALDFLIDFRGVSSNRLPSDKSLDVLTADQLLASLDNIRYRETTRATPPGEPPAASPAPRVERHGVEAGSARAPARPQRHVPRLRGRP